VRLLATLKGVALRRLFSTFARGGPGVGLLLLRLVVGIALIVRGTETFQGEPIGGTTLNLLALGDGVLLIAGLWTPIAGTALVILGLWGALVLRENPYPDVLLAAIGAALTLLGPGAWSVDARLFGWKRIDIER